MAFISGLVLGIAFGIFVVMAIARFENSRAQQRRELATTVVQFSNLTVEGLRKLLPPGFYPSWVVFTRRQKLRWLNCQLVKLWPYIDQAASELIRTSLDPVFEQYKSLVLSSIKFSKLTLGTVAPQFTGIEVLEDGSSGITMELEMEWDGNPNIVLDVKTTFGVSLPIQVKNIGFTGVFRIIFKPLVAEFPCFGAVCYSLREKKNLDFTLKVVGGEISAIPGLSDAIEGTIRDTIEDTLIWPNRKVIPVLPGDYRFGWFEGIRGSYIGGISYYFQGDLEMKPVGILDVKLVQARDLKNKDLVGKSDPYALVYIRPLRNTTRRSKTINNDLNPIWNESYEFVVEDPSTQSVTVKVFDDEGLQPSELIGCARVSLNQLTPGKVKVVWLDLVKDLDLQRDVKPRGQVHLELLYFPYDVPGIVNPFAHKFALTALEKALKTEPDDIGASAIEKRKNVIMRGVLSVTVISAEDLPPMDLTGKADPYVVIQLKKQGTRLKTRVVNETLEPIWNQTFDMVVEDGLHELLIFEVYDHDTFGKDYIGRCIMTLTRVILEGEFRDTFPLEGAKSGKLTLVLKWTAQPVYRDP